MTDNDKVSIAQAVKNLQENIIPLIELEKLNAKIMREKYLALVGLGFSEPQALELCKKASL